jgi:hypothetical protein
VQLVTRIPVYFSLTRTFKSSNGFFEQYRSITLNRSPEEHTIATKMADTIDNKQSVDGHCEVQVALRIRPLNAEERKAYSSPCVELTPVKNQIRVFQSDKSPYCQYFRVDKHFIFDQLFSQESDQEEVFEGIGMPMVKAGLDGFNTCIFCYGMTGSGKTFSMTGSKERPGLSSRIFSALFKCVEERKAQDSGFSAEISVSYVEIYNENLKDLLGKSGFNRTLEIRENASDGVHVKGLTDWKVASLQVISIFKNVIFLLAMAYHSVKSESPC